jgi:signal peptide peptidase SppA
MTESTALQAFMQRFSVGALVAPADAAGLSNIPAMVEQARAFLTADVSARERDMAQTFRDTLGAYGRANAEQGGRIFPYAGNGTAIIPVHGMLLNRYNYVSSYATGYNAIRSMLNAAMADADVTRVVLDINSFGGQAAGMFELASDIRAARERKPITAVVDSYAFSAAYGIASAASSIVLTPSGESGSIGVVSMHMNIGPALKNFGIDVTFIYAGKHKVEGNPYEALSDDARANIQARVDSLYGQFTAAVAAGRKGKMTDEAARKTEARVYDAEESVSLGLADSIMASDAVLATLENDRGDPTAKPTMQKETPTMTTENKPVDAAAEKQAERARIDAILNAPEAADRSGLARYLATKTDLSAEAAIAALAAAPKEVAAAPAERNLLAEAMGQTEQPNLGADAPGGEPDKDSPKAKSDRLAAAWTKATGMTFGKPN